MLTSNIIQRVLFVRYGENIGTGFTVEKNGKQYLISAKHIFPSLTKPDQITIFNDGDWRTISIRPIFCANNCIDIIAFDLEGKKLTPDYEVELGLGGVSLGQDAYFLGFPYGLFTNSGEINNKYPFPFVKKCIISSVNKQLIYLDGHNNRGFSGGPVIVLGNKHSIKIIGVVSGFLGDNLNKTENSGIFYAHSISMILDAIN